MIFTKRFNNILNIMFRNFPETRRYFTKFFKDIPEDLMDIINEKINQEYYDDGTQVITIFEPQKTIVEVGCEPLGYIKIDLNAITADMVPSIPYDQENDIFIDNEWGEITSPVCLNFVYSPEADENTEIDDLDYLFYVVEKRDGYYLVGQEMSDAGVHCTKIDINEFIVPFEETAKPQKIKLKKKKKFFKNLTD